MTDKEIVLSFVKAINDHDIGKISDLISEDHVFIDGYGNKQIGKEGMNFWKTTAAWKAIVQDKKIKQWQVLCDYTRLLEIINKKPNY